MVETGKRMGKKVVALITDMDQPLGRKVGNALEIEEVLEILNGQGPADLRELCDELSAWMFLLGGRVKTIDEGKRAGCGNDCLRAARAKHFAKLSACKAATRASSTIPAACPRRSTTERVTAPRTGYVTAIHCEQIGIASMMLGGGREKMEDKIDPAVGLILEKKPGDPVKAGETLCAIRYNSDARLRETAALLAKSFEVGPQRATVPPLVRKVIGA